MTEAMSPGLGENSTHCTSGPYTYNPARAVLSIDQRNVTCGLAGARVQLAHSDHGLRVARLGAPRVVKRCEIVFFSFFIVSFRSELDCVVSKYSSALSARPVALTPAFRFPAHTHCKVASAHYSGRTPPRHDLRSTQQKTCINRNRLSRYLAPSRRAGQAARKS